LSLNALINTAAEQIVPVPNFLITRLIGTNGVGWTLIR